MPAETATAAAAAAAQTNRLYSNEESGRNGQNTVYH